MPTSPGRRPAAARIAKSRNVVVVLPFVPVTPATSSSSRRLAEERVGRERHRGARVGDDDLRHVERRAAARRRARPRRARPPRRRSRGRRRARRARRRRPRPARPPRVSYARSATSTGARPTTSTAPSAAARRSRSIIAGESTAVAAADRVSGAVRRHLEVLQVERRDLRERRRRDDAAEDRAVRLVDADEDDEARVARGHDADERRDVLARLVAVRPRLLRRAGLAGDACSRGSRRPARCRCRRRRPSASAAASGRRRAREDAARAAARRGFSPCTWSTRCGCTQTPLFAIARVHRRQLHRRHRRRPARSARCRSSSPTSTTAAEPALSPGKSMPVGLPKPNCVDPLLERVSPSSVRAIVTVPTFDDCCEDLRDRHRLGAAHLGVVDHAVGDLDRVRQRERRLRRDDAVSDSAPAIVTTLNTEPGSKTSVTARLRRAGRRRRRTCSRRSPAPRPSRGSPPVFGSSTIAVALFARHCATVCAQHLLGVRLDLVVDRQERTPCRGAPARCALDRDRAAERILDDRLLARRARRAAVSSCELEPGEARCCRCRRSRAPAPRPRPAGTSRRSSAVEVEARRASASRAAPPSPDRPCARRRRSACPCGRERGRRRSASGRARAPPRRASRARVADLVRIGVDGRRLLADRERRAHASKIVPRPAGSTTGRLRLRLRRSPRATTRAPSRSTPRARAARRTRAGCRAAAGGSAS